MSFRVWLNLLFGLLHNGIVWYPILLYNHIKSFYEEDCFCWNAFVYRLCVRTQYVKFLLFVAFIFPSECSCWKKEKKKRITFPPWATRRTVKCQRLLLLQRKGYNQYLLNISLPAHNRITLGWWEHVLLTFFLTQKHTHWLATCI